MQSLVEFLNLLHSMFLNTLGTNLNIGYLSYIVRHLASFDNDQHCHRHSWLQYQASIKLCSTGRLTRINQSLEQVWHV